MHRSYAPQAKPETKVKRKRKPKRGRPRVKNPRDRTLTICIARREERAYEMMAAADGLTPAQWARAVLRQYVVATGPIDAVILLDS